MLGSTFGKLFNITTWGESHGKAVGVVIDGCPAGLPLSEADIQPFLDRRKPGNSFFTSPRSESDRCEILSGVSGGVTLGTPISVVIANENHCNDDYAALQNKFRPGHGDFVYDQKFGPRGDGGGRASGRETAGRVAAGAVAIKILSQLGVTITAYTETIGGVMVDGGRFDLSEAAKNPLYIPSADAFVRAAALVEQARANGDSLGGVAACIVFGMPPGVGEPVFDKLDAALASAILSIGGVKGFELGAGFQSAEMTGSACNDALSTEDGARVSKTSNHSGGITAGLSDGGNLFFRAAFKPTPSIAISQNTVLKAEDGTFHNTSISVSGRHDPVIVPRAVVVVECMTALVLVDFLMRNTLSKMEALFKYYRQEGF